MYRIIEQYLARGIVLACFLILRLGAAQAQDLDLPGVDTDAAHYVDQLQSRFPAGGTPDQRDVAEADADRAAAAQDWNAVAAALQRRAGAGEMDSGQWSALADALLQATPADPRHALLAAWEAFSQIDTPEAQLPPLRLMDRALAALHEEVARIAVLEAIVARAPDDAKAAAALGAARQSVGLQTRSVRTEPDAFPARACVSLTGRPGGSADFHIADWVRLDPPLADAAVTLEDGKICATGLPPGRGTTMILRAGMPGEGGISLKQDARLAIVMPDRQPQLIFDAARFIQPSAAAAAVSLSSVNISAVKLALVHVSERNLLSFLQGNQGGFNVGAIASVIQNAGRVVWEGRAPIPRFAPNALLKTLLPLPAGVLREPGLYALLAQPGDGTPGGVEAPAAMQMILRTDLAPSIWRGSDGLTVQLRGYASGAVKPGAHVALIATNNDVLASAVTDAAGVAHFAAALLAGTNGMTPQALHISGPDGDFTTLDLTRPAFDLSDRGVSGRAPPGPLDAFVWLDRGIYRPGETVQVMALLRDAAGEPAAVPLHVIVRRPGGQVFADVVPVPRPDGALYLPLALPGGAQLGAWDIALAADPKAPDAAPIGHASFIVDAFVPARLAVDLTPPAGPLAPGAVTALPVAVRFLYGAPGAALSGTGSLRYTVNPTPFSAYEAYRFGLADEALTADRAQSALPVSDAEGHTSFAIDLTHLPDVTSALLAHVRIGIDDPAGREVAAHATLPIRPAGPMIGLRPDFANDAVDADTPAGFDIIALDPEGKRIAMPAELSLVRQTPDWRLVTRQGSARYEMVWRDEPVLQQKIVIDAGQPFHLAKTLSFGRYRLRVVQTGGMAASSLSFDAGWAWSPNPDLPERVRVSTDRAQYKPGETARVHVEAPYAGPASLLLLGDRVIHLASIDIAAGGSDVRVPIGADWGPGAYVVAQVYHPMGNDPKAMPSRAVGLAWLKIDPAGRTLPLRIETAALYRPRGTARIAVHTAPGAFVTLAAVDEGVLRLTDFANPDPLAYFLGRQALGVDLQDGWGGLLPAATGEPTELHEGGGPGGPPDSAVPIPQQVVALFSPPVQAGPDGIALIPLSLPDFDGQLRLMAVGWQGAAIGSAASDIILRDPLVAEPLLPRFLAPGDAARLAVLVQNVELPPGPVRVHLTVGGALTLDGAATLDASLGRAEKQVLASQLRATRAGIGEIALDVTGPAGFSSHHDVRIAVHPARAPVVRVMTSRLDPGQESVARAPVADLLPGSWTASVSVGTAIRYDVAGMLRALADFPLDCLEQATSRGFPLAMLPDGPLAGPDRAGRVQQALESVLNRQRADGAFGLWSSEDAAEPWLSAYATEFLLRARAGGAEVPAQPLEQALLWLRGSVEEPAKSPDAVASQAYALYVLALAGRPLPGAIRLMAADFSALPTPLARAQLGAALARLNAPQAAAAAFKLAFAAPVRQRWEIDYGSTLRDRFAVDVLAQESGQLAGRHAEVLGALPGADLDPEALDTQQQAWAAIAAAVLDQDGTPLTLALDGIAQPPTAPGMGQLTRALTDTPLSVRNLGRTPVWQSLTVAGVPIKPPAAARAGMVLRRLFFGLDGKPLDPDKLHQNSVFVMLIEGSATDGQPHRAMLQAGLPAGWEIAGRLPSGVVAGMDWLGTLSDTLAEPATDDRYAAALVISQEQPDFRLAILLRAVTPGDFEYPGMTVSDMYRPGVFARQGATRIGVLPP